MDVINILLSILLILTCGLFFVAGAADFVIRWLGRGGTERTCATCVHLLPTDNVKSGQCELGGREVRKFNVVTGETERKDEFTYCSIARGHGTWFSLVGGLLMTKRPFCSKHGWWWRPVISPPDGH